MNYEKFAAVLLVLAVISGLILSAVNIGKQKTCIQWETSADKKLALGSSSYITAVFALQIVAILYLAKSDYIKSLIG
jgi:hypothetical protein